MQTRKKNKHKAIVLTDQEQLSSLEDALNVPRKCIHHPILN